MDSTQTNATKGPATPADFARWEELAREMSTGQLRYAINDCRAAERAVEAHDDIAAGRYADQRMTFETELARRGEKR